MSAAGARPFTWWSTIAQSWQAAVESLAAHKLRSGLTLLGIVVGTSAVLVSNAFGQLTEGAVARQFGPLGATLVNVAPEVPPPPSGAVPGQRVTLGADSSGAKPAPPPDLDDKDLQAISALPHVNSAALHSSVPPTQLIAGGQNQQSPLIAATPRLSDVMGYTLAAGSFFTNDDEAARANVVVLGATLARNLFPGQDPVGQAVQLNNVPFTVRGVLAAQGSNGQFDLDQVGIVPYSVADRLRGNARVFVIQSNGNPAVSSGVSIQVDAIQNISQVESSAVSLLQQLHPPQPGQQPFVASDFSQAVDVASQSTREVRLALAGIAGIGLLLGAFGVFSMMTVSVSERTREIGLRMAVGARTADVRTQFLLEAGMLGLAGGVLGAVLGSAAAALAPSVLHVLGEGGAALPSVGAILGVIGGSVVLGVLFGVLPAQRAAHLDPATALRRA